MRYFWEVSFSSLFLYLCSCEHCNCYHFVKTYLIFNSKLFNFPFFFISLLLFTVIWLILSILYMYSYYCYFLFSFMRDTFSIKFIFTGSSVCLQELLNLFYEQEECTARQTQDPMETVFYRGTDNVFLYKKFL